MNRHSSSRIIRFFFSLWRESPVLVLCMIGTQILFTVLTTTIAPLFVSQLLTHIADGTATVDTSISLLVGYAIVLLFGDVIAIRFSIGFAYIVESKMQAKVAERVLEHLMKRSLGYHSNRMSGGIVSDSTKLNGSIERFWDTIIFTVTPIVTTLLSVSIALSFIYWQYALALAVLSITIIVIIVRIQSSIAPVSRKVAEKSSAMTAYFADVVSNIAAVKAFAGEDYELTSYKKRVKEWRTQNLKEMKTVLLISGSFGLLMTILNVTAFIAAVIATQYNIVAIGVIYLVISYTLNVVSQLWSVGNTTRAYIRIIGDAGPMISTLDEAIELSDPKKPEKLTISKGSISFENITFTHSETEKPLFNNFSLEVKPGEKVGLVGPSGSGKTSLTRLLLRFSDLDSGHILIDGQKIDRTTQKELHNTIAYVPQEPLLFHRTLEENIAYGNPEAPTEEVRRAAKEAHALEFIDALPNGFDTLVGERGVKLSGGQRQRVAIARAILKDAPILVLDEATSALDSESESLIQKALKKLMEGRTSIVIAHRLSTIAKLDRIIVMEDGAIIEDGSHEELLAKNGKYAQLWAHQSGGFIEE